MNYQEIAKTLIDMAKEQLPIVMTPAQLVEFEIFSNREIRMITQYECEPAPVRINQRSVLFPKKKIIDYLNRLMDKGEGGHTFVIEKLVGIL